MTKTDRILEIIQQVADQLRVFERRGPGAGNLVTNQAVAAINALVEVDMGQSVLQRALNPSSNQSVDFYIEEEKTIIEVEFSLSNPYPCLEKDAFKALLAKSAYPVETLVMVGDPGCGARLAAPAPRAICEWLRQNQSISVRVVELLDAPIRESERAATV